MAKKKSILDTTLDKIGPYIFKDYGKAPAPSVPPQQIQQPQTTSNPATTSGGSGKTEVFRNEKGNLSAAQLPDGRIFLGLSPDDVRNLAAQQNQKQATPPGAVEASQAAAQRRMQTQGAEAANQIGNISQMQQQQIQNQKEAPVDYGQAVTAGLANALPGAIGGAIGGAAVGVVGSAGVASAPLAIAGGVGGFAVGLFTGIRSNIKKQQSGNIAATKDVLNSAKTNMRQLAILAKQDPNNADMYVAAYNQQLSNVYAAQAKLKLETQGNLNKFMDDGTQDLSDFELFLAPGGAAEIYGTRLQIVLASGGAYEFTAEDLADMSGVVTE